MISDERLEEISQCSDVSKLFAYEQRQMARELLAHRKAWSEPVAGIWFDSFYGVQVSLQEGDWKQGDYLYRKPNTREV